MMMEPDRDVHCGQHVQEEADEPCGENEGDSELLEVFSQPSRCSSSSTEEEEEDDDEESSAANSSTDCSSETLSEPFEYVVPAVSGDVPVYDTPRRHRLATLQSESGCSDDATDQDEMTFHDTDHVEEANIYEELSQRVPDGDVAENNSMTGKPSADSPSHWSLVGEVQRVQQQHAQVLQELNLDMEQMLMPQSPTMSPVQSDTSENAPNYISPVPATSPTSHQVLSARNSAPSFPSNWMARPPYRRSKSLKSVPSTPSSPAQNTATSVKRWFNKLPTLASFREKRVTGTVEETVVTTEEPPARRHTMSEDPVYMLYDDTYRRSSLGPSQNLADYTDEVIYEDIDNIHQGNNSQDFQEFESYEDDPSESDSESEKSVRSTTSLAKSGANSIKQKLHNVKLRVSRFRVDSISKKKDSISEGENKFLRLFGRKKEYNVDKGKHKRSMPQLLEEEETLVGIRILNRNLPLTLPPAPHGLTPDQMKRRYIVGALIQSENSYLASLTRLIQDYQTPLEESNPPIVSLVKVRTLFHRVADIQMVHSKFRVALSTYLRKWDRDEKLGDAFVNHFASNAILEIYSDFINNFSIAMELAKQESKRKSAFADFLKVKQITSNDRLSFFGLMVKPVQRFPQFIMLLQDLLKETPLGHHDRMILQMALTQLENLAETLNERKRESEQQHAVKEVLRHVMTRTSSRSLIHGAHFLLRQDTMTQLMFSPTGHVVKSKTRRLFLLNDILVCVSVSLKSVGEFQNGECFSLKWAVPIGNVEVQDEVSPTLTRMLAAMAAGRGSVSKADKSTGSNDGNRFQSLCQELGDLLHDFEVLGRVSSLVQTLRKDYDGLSVELLQFISQSIQKEVHQKDQEMQWIDSCCLQIAVTSKTKTGKEQRDLHVFQTDNASIKQLWITDLRLAQMAIASIDTPAWLVPELEQRPLTKLPLFVRSVPLHAALDPTEVKCGCYYQTVSSRPLSVRLQEYVWLCTSDGINCVIRACCLRHTTFREIAVLEFRETRISTMEVVVGSKGELECTMWMGTDSRKVMVYNVSDAEHPHELGVAIMSAPVLQIRHHLRKVFVALCNGTIALFIAKHDGGWQLKEHQLIMLGTEPVTCLLPVGSLLYCGCGRRIWTLDANTVEITKSYPVQDEQMGSVYAIAHSGVGLWLNLRNTATLCLYHTENFQHLQNINVAPLVQQVLAENDAARSPRRVFVTALLASRGFLWVGTNVGVTVTLPLPRLEGVPLVTGRANVSCHRLAGPVNLLLALTARPKSSRSAQQIRSQSLPIGEGPSGHEKLGVAWNLQRFGNNNSVVTRQSGNGLRGVGSKTLPLQRRSLVSNQGDDVYGLYGNLLNVTDCVEDPVSSSLDEELRRSDPDLLPNLVNTLDRRLRLKSCRPRSLDLSNMQTSTSEPLYLSSGSENSSSCVSIADSSQSNNTCPENSSEAAGDSTTNPISFSHTFMRGDRGKASASASEADFVSPSATKVAPTTVLMLAGGRGYAYSNKTARPKKGKGNGDIPLNCNDSYVLLWETKL